MTGQVSTSLRGLLDGPFATVSDLFRAQADHRPDRPAIITDAGRVGYGELNMRVDQLAVALQGEGVEAGQTVALCAAGSVTYIAAFLAILRIGAVPTPLPATAAPRDLAMMVADAGAGLIFVDAAAGQALAPSPELKGVRRVILDDDPDKGPLKAWSAPAGVRPRAGTVRPDQPFNIIYSSGTTGRPKGIVQPHQMRWAHIQRARTLGYGPEGVTLVATQPYSNLTLVSLLPTLALGGAVALAPEFDAKGFLELAARTRATHTFLVPVQYRRILDAPDFDTYDLSSFSMKVCAGAPCSPALKREILARWPGELIDLYGMTEGGGTCLLYAKANPGKLHTVGRPQEGHDIRILKEDGAEAGPGEAGEVVGRSGSMMTGYHNQPDKTREAEWYDSSGHRFIRTGDIGIFDQDGFLAIVDRKKDMIISGGFNIYPSDIEAVLREHAAVADAAVVGVPSERWGETPVGFVILRDGETASPGEIQAWANARLGKTQRLSAVHAVASFPRSAIDKVLKTALRDQAIAAAA